MDALRYVILQHCDRAGEHWDLMIEQPTALATWKLRRDPTVPGVLPVEGGRIADHRKVYLEYEGPVSGDRGEVRRVDEGVCRVLDAGKTGWRFELEGRCLSGRFALRPCGVAGDRWRLEVDAGENSQGGQAR